MYEYTRTTLQRAVTAAQQARAAAEQAVAAAQGGVTSAAAAVTAAAGVLDGARGGLSTAQANLGAAQAGAASAAQAAAAAQAAVTAWEQEMPEPYIDGFAADPLDRPSRLDRQGRELPGGGYPHPNPEYDDWLRQYNVLVSARNAANAARATADGYVATAQGAVGTAAAQVASAQAAVVARTQEQAAATARLGTAQAAAQSAASAVTAAQTRVADLDARAARLVAEPLDRATVTALADEEQDQVASLRRQRADVRSHRHDAEVTRSTLLAAHDAGVAALAPLASALRGWSDPAFPDPAAVGALLDAAVGAARGQAASTPRTDDLAGLASQVQAALGRLQTTVDAAVQERDHRLDTLEAAREAVALVVEDQP